MLINMRKHSFTLSRDLKEEGLINLTPLIDVVFVVLILFILVAPLLEIDRISLASGPPKEMNQTPAIQNSPLIQIHVFADNTIWVNQTPISDIELSPFIKKCKEQTPTAIPQIYQDKEAFFGTYQKVKNALEFAGFQEMDVILKSGD